MKKLTIQITTDSSHDYKNKLAVTLPSPLTHRQWDYLVKFETKGKRSLVPPFPPGINSLKAKLYPVHFEELVFRFEEAMSAHLFANHIKSLFYTDEEQMNLLET